MKESLLKVEKDSMVLKPVINVPVWKGSNIAEAFDSDGKTKLAAGVHEIFPSEVVVTMDTDDILYMLEGELEIEVNGVKKKYHAGDFAYLYKNTEVIFKVLKYSKQIYVSYPANWKEEQGKILSQY